MVTIKTYQDLLAASTSNKKLTDFLMDAVSEHKASNDYVIASDAELYATGQNATISKYQKILYTLTGKAVPDNYNANHKCKSGFFKRSVIQETSVEVGNGVSFGKKDTKAKLGNNIDSQLYKAVKTAIVQSVAFCFYDLGQIKTFKLTEFVPLYDENTSALKAGIRFTQVDGKPLKIILFEEDGYTEFVTNDKNKLVVDKEKTAYVKRIKSSVIDGTEIAGGRNYSRLPIIPLWANMDHQSEIVGIREQIDCYDLIKSGFANDLDDASMIYWVLEGTGGMKDVDLAKFIERMKTVRAAVIDSEGGAKAEAHTLEVPYQSREVYLARLEEDLYKDAMALDVNKLAAGNVTATQIRAAYEPLAEKCDELEMCLNEFFDQLLELIGIEDKPTFERSIIVNQPEITQMVLSAAEYLDDETILKKLPFLTVDEIDTILKNVDKEDFSRFETKPNNEPNEDDDQQIEE